MESQKYRTGKNLETCARRIIETRFHEMMRFKEGVIDGTDIEYVHDMRVSSRRLRAALRNFADCFPQKKKFREHLKQAENITATMGDVLGLDVLIDRFRKDMQAMLDEEEIGIGNLIEHLAQRREKVRQSMLKMFEELNANGFNIEFLKFFRA